VILVVRHLGQRFAEEEGEKANVGKTKVQGSDDSGAAFFGSCLLPFYG
jgi:hypothetical protein